MKKRSIYYLLLGAIETATLAVFGVIVLILPHQVSSIFNYHMSDTLLWLCILLALFLPLGVNLIIFLKDKREYLKSSFFSVFSAAILTVIFWFSGVYNIFGDFAYSKSINSGGFISLNLDAAILMLYSCINAGLMFFACILNVLVKYYKRWKQLQNEHLNSESDTER